MRRLARFAVPLLSATLTLAACAGRPVPVAVVAPPPAPAPTVAAAPPAGFNPALTVPPRGPDGRYLTPNATVSPAGAVWHLRAGLNVAALACRGPDEAALVAQYNAVLRAHAAGFDRAYRSLGTEHGGVAAFDAAMTRLYNYYALPPAQAGLCETARAVLTELALVPADGLAGYAPAALARLDQPYVTVFAAQDAWLASRALVAAAPPRLTIDLSVLSRP